MSKFGLKLGPSGGIHLFWLLCVYVKLLISLCIHHTPTFCLMKTEDNLEANCNCKDLTWQKYKEFLNSVVKKKTKVTGLREEGEEVRFIDIPAIIGTKTADSGQALDSRWRLLLLYRQFHSLWASAIIVLCPCCLNQKMSRFDPRPVLVEFQAVYDPIITLGVLCRSFERQITTSKAARFHQMLST